MGNGREGTDSGREIACVNERRVVRRSANMLMVSKAAATKVECVEGGPLFTCRGGVGQPHSQYVGGIGVQFGDHGRSERLFGGSNEGSL